MSFWLRLRKLTEETVSYRQLAFKYYDIKRNRCFYSKYRNILVVHHKDRNRLNNAVENLEILCLNCHAEEHINDRYELGSGHGNPGNPCKIPA